MMEKKKSKSINDWVCERCGPVKPKIFLYSYPMKARCPFCHMLITELKVFKVFSLEDLKKKRPELYKKEEE